MNMSFLALTTDTTLVMRTFLGLVEYKTRGAPWYSDSKAQTRVYPMSERDVNRGRKVHFL